MSLFRQEETFSRVAPCFWKRIPPLRWLHDMGPPSFHLTLRFRIIRKQFRSRTNA